MKSANTQECANSSNQQAAADIAALMLENATLALENARLRAELLAARADAAALRRDVEFLSRKANRTRRHPWGPQVPP